jgi:hypothetical protein
MLAETGVEEEQEQRDCRRPRTLLRLKFGFAQTQAAAKAPEKSRPDLVP